MLLRFGLSAIDLKAKRVFVILDKYILGNVIVLQYIINSSKYSPAAAECEMAPHGAHACALTRMQEKMHSALPHPQMYLVVGAKGKTMLANNMNKALPHRGREREIKIEIIIDLGWVSEDRDCPG